VRTTTLLAFLASGTALSLAACATEDAGTGTGDELAAQPIGEPAVDPADPAEPSAIAAEPTYFFVRPDIRICDAPACGGFMVTTVNGAIIGCPDGTTGTSCYVAAADNEVPGLPPPDRSLAGDRGDVIVGATITSEDYPGVGRLGHLNIFEVWNAGAAAGEPVGTGARVQLNGVMCIQAPCPDKDEHILNTDEVNAIADLDFAPSGATEAEIATAVTALDGKGPGLIVVGDEYVVEGPTGATAAGRTVTQFYLPVSPVTTALLSTDQCAQLGGKVRGDRGDGTVACLAGEEELGRVSFGTEGGVCCSVE
jgi:hypothetical protein